MKKFILPVILVFLVVFNAFGSAYQVNKGFVYQSTVGTNAFSTTTLVSTSNQVQIAEGTDWQIYKLPNAQLLPNDWSYVFENNSSSYLTIRDNGGNDIASVNSGKVGRFYLKDHSTTNGTWKFNVMDLIASVSQIITDHGDLTGLSDDDHPQYHNDARGDLRYYTKSEFINATLGVGDADKPIKTNASGVIDPSLVPNASSPLTTKGDIWAYSTLDARFPVGSDNSVIVADSSSIFGFRWGLPQNYWSTTGNAGLNAATDWLGTQDATDLVFKTNDTEVLRLTSAGAIDTTLSAGIATINSTGVLSSTDQSNLMHRYLGGLLSDDHTQYFLLAGRSGGQTAYCGTASGDDCVISSTSNATKGDITIGQSYQEFSTGKVRYGDISTGAPASSVLLAFATTAGNPNISFQSSSGQRWIMDPNSSSWQFNRQANDVVGFALTTSSQFQTGDGAPTLMASFSNSGSSVTDITAPTTGNVTPIVEIRNRNTTVNNYSGLVFENQQSATIAGIFGINENHSSSGSQTGHLDFLTANAGTKARAMSIAANKTVTMDGYGAGIATFNSTGLISSQGLNTVLDNFFGQVRGSILYRGASGWNALPPATINSVLLTKGSGTDPVYGSLVAGSNITITPGTTSLTIASTAGGGSVGSPTSYTQAITGSTSNPTKGTTTIDQATYLKVGKILHMNWNYKETSGGSDGSGIYLFTIPNSEVADTTYMTCDTQFGSIVGTAHISNTTDNESATSSSANVYCYDTTHLAMAIQNAASSNFRFQSGGTLRFGNPPLAIQMNVNGLIIQ